MKKIAVLLLALCALGLAYAGKPSVNVTNPMTADLDGGTYAISNVSAIRASTIVADVALYSGQFQAGGARGTIQLSDANGSGVNVDGGYENPTGIGLEPGSLWLRRVDSAHGELWFKTGPLPTDWVRVAP